MRTIHATVAELHKKFQARYGVSARIFRAPGRVNLIGEHTDYNAGFVMPAAIDYHVWVAIAAREDKKLVLHSENFSESVEIDLEDSDPHPRKYWSDYVHGVAVTVEHAGHHLRGANLLIRGDVPIGAGLASSAAIEVSTGFALLENSGLALARVELAKLCQRAENEFVGARVGIMDQFVSCFGREGHALMLDCRSLRYRLLPLPEAVSVVICNTMVRHELSGTEYNTRRAECEHGVHLFSALSPQVRSLRDASPLQFNEHAGKLPENIRKRCRHVINENSRVESAAAALEAGDLAAFGRLMYESHCSLRDDYEVSCAELDLMVDLARKQTGVYGARMTGGGFGGCTVNLVKNDAVAQFKNRVAREYQQATGLAPEIFVTSAAEGVEEIIP